MLKYYLTYIHPPPCLIHIRYPETKLLVALLAFFLHKVPDVNSTLEKDKWKLETGDSATSNLSWGVDPYLW